MFEEFCQNRYRHGGKGLEALERCDLEDGVYVMGGNNSDFSAGHCVVLEIEMGKVTVYEEDVIGGVVNLDWLHHLAFVYRFRLRKPPMRPALHLSF